MNMKPTPPRATFEDEQVPKKPYRCTQPLDPLGRFGSQPGQPIHSSRHGTVTNGKGAPPHPAPGESGHLSLNGSSSPPLRHLAFPASIAPSASHSRK